MFELLRIKLPSQLFGDYHKYTTQGVVCIFIPQLLRFKIKKIETAKLFL